MENKTTNRAKMSDKRCLKARLQFHSAVIVKRHHKPSVLIYFSAFSDWPAWFFLQIFCLNNKIHFSSGLKMTVNENLWMKQPTIPPWLAGKIVKYRPLSEPIRLQDLEDFRLLASLEKNKICYVVFFFSYYQFLQKLLLLLLLLLLLFHLFIYWIFFCRVISIFHVPGSFLNFLEICSVVCSMIFSDIWHKHHRWYFKIVIGNFTSR